MWVFMESKDGLSSGASGDLNRIGCRTQNCNAHGCEIVSRVWHGNRITKSVLGMLLGLEKPSVGRSRPVSAPAKVMSSRCLSSQ